MASGGAHLEVLSVVRSVWWRRGLRIQYILQYRHLDTHPDRFGVGVGLDDGGPAAAGAGRQAQDRRQRMEGAGGDALLRRQTQRHAFRISGGGGGPGQKYPSAVHHH